jgi:transcription elongation factor Elf1
MDWLDHKYIGLASSHLSFFKRKNNLYNFRCPYCGDSKKSRTKARGYIVESKGKAFFKCHNCGVSTTLHKLLQHINNDLADQFKAEKFKDLHGDSQRPKLIDKLPDITSTAKPVFIKYSPLKTLKKISQLKPDHPVKQYVQKRLIPSNFHYKIFYAPSFKRWVNSFIPDKFDFKTPDEPRLVIPLLDSYGNLIGLQGRNFSKNGLRYITIIVDESKPKMYGLDHTDIKKLTYIFEGPIDSMFIPNSLAMSGADCLHSLQQVGIQQENVVMCYDNEPRNEEICKRISKVIDLGFKVLLWPSHIKQKDVNDMVVAGIKPADIKLIIDNNTFRGLEAKMRFATWRKC